MATAAPTSCRRAGSRMPAFAFARWTPAFTRACIGGRARGYIPLLGCWVVGLLGCQSRLPPACWDSDCWAAGLLGCWAERTTASAVGNSFAGYDLLFVVGCPWFVVCCLFFPSTLKLRVSLTPAPERRRRHCWACSFRTPPCHRNPHCRWPLPPGKNEK